LLNGKAGIDHSVRSAFTSERVKKTMSSRVGHSTFIGDTDATPGTTAMRVERSQRETIVVWGPEGAY